MTEKQKRDIRLFKEALKEAVADYAEDVIDAIECEEEMIDPEVIALIDMMTAIKNYTEA